MTRSEEVELERQAVTQVELGQGRATGQVELLLVCQAREGPQKGALEAGKQALTVQHRATPESAPTGYTHGK
jgi:hypothetical protein